MYIDSWADKTLLRTMSDDTGEEITSVRILMLYNINECRDSILKMIRNPFHFSSVT